MGQKNDEVKLLAAVTKPIRTCGLDSWFPFLVKKKEKKLVTNFTEYHKPETTRKCGQSIDSAADTRRLVTRRIDDH